MTKTTKITKSMKYNSIIEILESLENGVDITPKYEYGMLIDFLYKEEQATHKSKKVSAKEQAKKAEDEKVKDLIVNLLQEKGCEMRATEVWSELGLNRPTSVQKTTYLLTQLVKDGRLEKFVSKRVAFYKSL